MSQSGIAVIEDGELPPDVPLIFAGNVGTGSAIAHLFEIIGTGSVSTSVSGNILTISDSALTSFTLTGNSGIATSSAGNINVLGSGNITFSGAVSTLTGSLTGITNHNVLVGGASNTITNVPPVHTGYVLTDNGPGVSPTFQPAGGGSSTPSIAPYVVGTTGVNDYATIQAAINAGIAANAYPFNVYVKPDHIYAENLSFAGTGAINIVGLGNAAGVGDQQLDVIASVNLSGTVTLTGTNQVSFSNFFFSSASGNVFNTGNTILSFEGCTFTLATAGTFFYNHTGSPGECFLSINNCGIFQADGSNDILMDTTTGPSDGTLICFVNNSNLFGVFKSGNFDEFFGNNSGIFMAFSCPDPSNLSVTLTGCNFFNYNGAFDFMNTSTTNQCQLNLYNCVGSSFGFNLFSTTASNFQTFNVFNSTITGAGTFFNSNAGGFAQCLVTNTVIQSVTALVNIADASSASFSNSITIGSITLAGGGTITFLDSLNPSGHIQNDQGGIATKPAASAASTLAFGSAYQNTLGYDVLLIVYVDITANTSLVFQSGVGPTNTPTQQTIITGSTSKGFLPITVYLPNNYYALISKSGVGTATIIGQQVTPI